MECPACHSALYSQTFNAWECMNCGYSEVRSDDYAMSVDIRKVGYDGSLHIPRKDRYENKRQPGTLKAFYKLKHENKVAALSYLQEMDFLDAEHFNSRYLAAKLAIELRDKEKAQKNLNFCLQQKDQAKCPELIDRLKSLYSDTFVEG